MSEIEPTLPSHAENKAQHATRFQAFNRLNLHSIRADVATILAEIGKTSIFSQYTKHDISHIDSMLASLDWIIPKDSQQLLTPADYLMLVLATYFHDMGMVVTEAEFTSRHLTPFDDYKTAVAYGDRGAEYQEKVAQMDTNEGERFLYQEFVRENHPHRIRAWISSQTFLAYGNSLEMASAVKALLSPADDRFRRDLALVCESHHADDLNDFTRYKTSQPYGSSREEECNVHYCALILRTADLVHVTRDRTPSIAFRLINPTDPKSIVEWHKQMATVAVRPVKKKNNEGEVVLSQQSDTIGFHALFNDPDGYFSLTSYLSYVRNQLRQSADWAEAANRKQGSQLLFPWRNVDETDVEAEGFLRKQFGFTLDQAKILDLLTGHTLYNDANVVIRELVQNGIDAVRLCEFEDPGERDGSVSISWNTSTATLTIEDTGTGMTQDTIERHFLRAGSSRYQDTEFKKSFPGFSSISRFGIGVLSTFMISDEVEVFTVARSSDEKARKLTLRSLHGKYLIKEYDRLSDEVPSTIRRHGTRVVLKVRTGTHLNNVLASARKWVLFPPCKVSLVEDGKEAISVGFDSPKAAIEATLVALGVRNVGETDAESRRIVVREFRKEGLVLAAAFQWSEWFREWEFFNIDWVKEKKELLDSGSICVGSCVEGIRIDEFTPGYRGLNLLAVANASGPGSPRTNVARSGFEATREMDHMLENIYGSYCDHIRSEIERMQREEAVSLTWTVVEAGYVAQSLFPPRTKIAPINISILEKSISDVPAILVDGHAGREIRSVSDLAQLPVFWTVDSLSLQSIEALFKELPHHLSFSDLRGMLKENTIQLPAEPILAGLKEGGVLLDLVFRSREVSKVHVREKERRIDLCWIANSREQLWLPIRIVDDYTRAGHSHRFFAQPDGVFVQTGKVEVLGLDGYLGFKSRNRWYLLEGRRFTRVLLDVAKKVEDGRLPREVLLALVSVCTFLCNKRIVGSDSQQFIKAVMGENRTRQSTFPTNFLESAEGIELVELVSRESFKFFDANSWTRGAGSEMEF